MRGPMYPMDVPVYPMDAPMYPTDEPVCPMDAPVSLLSPLLTCSLRTGTGLFNAIKSLAKKN